MAKRLWTAVGIETLGGVFTPIVPSNSRLPCEKREGFSTGEDNQNQIKIRVFQGKEARVSNKRMRSLGNYEVQNIAPAQRGTPLVEVTFRVASDGEFILLARDAREGVDLEVTAEKVVVAVIHKTPWERICRAAMLGRTWGRYAK